MTTFAQSTNSGATETIALAPSYGLIQDSHNVVNELVSRVAGGAARFEGVTDKPVKSVSLDTQVIKISATPRNASAFSTSVQGVATETMSFTYYPTAYSNGRSYVITLGGTKTTGDTIGLTFYDVRLPGGSETVSYTAKSSDSLSSMANGLQQAINNDGNLYNIGIYQAFDQLSFRMQDTTTTPVSTTSFVGFTTGTPTETATLSTPTDDNPTVTIAGTITTNEVVKLTIQNAGLPGGEKTVSYQVASGNPATLAWSQSFSDNAQLPPGSSLSSVSATDGGNNTKTNSYGLSANTSSSVALTFDANGNMTSYVSRFPRGTSIS